jgi:HD-like signal output (HDOD) protein
MDFDSERMTDGSQVWFPQRIQDIPPETRQMLSQVVDQMPELPLSVSRVIEMTEDDESNLRELVELVSSDPALVSNILRVVNSSYYGLRNKTDNLHLAIVLLGYREVRQIAMHSFFRRSFGGGEGIRQKYLQELWEHSYLVSVCAESLAGEDDQRRRGVLLTLGLLHDIGKFVLYDIASLMRERKIAMGTGTPGNEQFLLAREERLFGVNHTVVGRLLAEKWNLSDRFAAVLQHHHSPSFYGISELPGEYIEDITAVCIADLLVHRFRGADNELPAPHSHFFALIGEPQSLDDLLTEERVTVLNRAHEFVAALQ